MRDFFEDFWPDLYILLMILLCLFLAIRYIDSENEQRLAIINNQKENVVKYSVSNCEKIDGYYYCWEE